MLALGMVALVGQWWREARKPKKEMVAAHLVNLAWNGLRGLDPDRPVLRGSAQNPDVFFQAREACTPFHAAVPGAVQAAMDRFAARTGRRYNLFDYYGDPMPLASPQLSSDLIELVRLWIIGDMTVGPAPPEDKWVEGTDQ